MPTCPNCKTRLPLLGSWRTRNRRYGYGYESCRVCNSELEVSHWHFVWLIAAITVSGTIAFSEMGRTLTLGWTVLTFLIAFVIGLLDRWFFAPVYLPKNAVQIGKLLT